MLSHPQRGSVTVEALPFKIERRRVACIGFACYGSPRLFQSGRFSCGIPWNRFSRHRRVSGHNEQWVRWQGKRLARQSSFFILSLSQLAMHEALFQAVATADVAAIDAYFTQDHVRAEVHRTNALIPQSGYPSSRLKYPDGTDFTPWYYGPNSSTGTFILPGRGFDLHVDVLLWFLAPERLDLLGPTLALLLYDISWCVVDSGQHDLLELLLTTTVFLSVYSTDQQQRLLDSMLILASNRSTRLMGMLVAHGANVDSVMVGKTKCAEGIDLLVDQGCTIVGVKIVRDILFAQIPLYTSLRRFLHHGGVCGDVWQKICYWPCSDYAPELVRVFINEGHVDVSARNSNTAIPDTVFVDHIMFTLYRMRNFKRAIADWQREIAQMLVKYGAEVDARDASDKTPLLYAVDDFFNLDVVTLLLELGADPNQTDSRGRSAIEILCTKTNFSGVGATMLELLLRHGADIWRPSSTGRRRIVEHLLTSPAAWRFVDNHIELFRPTERDHFVLVLGYRSDPLLLGGCVRAVCDRLLDTEAGRTFLAADQELSSCTKPGTASAQVSKAKKKRKRNIKRTRVMEKRS